MPLYKKTTSKAKVKTQSSFISPLLSQVSTQNKIKDLINDDYKENFPIPTKKKLLEPLINTISNDGNLLDKLQRKSFKDRDGKRKFNKETSPKFADLINDIRRINKSNKEGSVMECCSEKSPTKNNTTTKRAKSKELSKTLSDLTSQSPLLFNPSPVNVNPIRKTSKKLKTENSMTITTKIEISSDTDGDPFNIKRATAPPNFQLNDMLNDCVMNNLKISKQFLNANDFSEKNSTKTTTDADDNQTMQQRAPNIKIDDESEFESSLRDILDDVVNTNIVLSQKMMNDDASIKCNEKESKEKNMKQQKKINQKLVTKKQTKRVEKSKENLKAVDSKNSEDYIDSSLRSILDDVVNTNIMLSQEMDDALLFKGINTKTKVKTPKKNNGFKPEKKRTKTKAELKQASKDNIRALIKSKEKIRSFKSKVIEYQNSEEDIKIKSLKRIRAPCPKQNTKQMEPVNYSKDLNEDNLKKNKANDAGKKLKEKIKNKYLIEKQKTVKGKKEKSVNNINLEKEQNKNKKRNGEKLHAKDLNKGDKKMKRKSFTLTKSLSNYNMEENKKARCPPKPKNMIFTSDNPKTNKMDLKKLLELQEERDVGLYVYCDTCDKVRYLPQCKDPLDLPAKWYCHMNPDPNYNKCNDPDFEIEPEKEEIIIHNKYNAGSIVWAKMDGFPWWPAMVDDDPDLTDYFWLDDLETSTEPSWYHVTFFDSSEVTRAWIRTANLEPFEVNVKNPIFKPKRYDNYRYRINFASREAKTAGKMELLKRLRMYSFVVRYFKKRHATGNTKNEGRKRSRPKKTDTEKIIRDNKKDLIIGQNNTNKDPTTLDENNYFCDNLSIASSEMILDILKPKKSGKNNVASDDEILENIDLNQFIRNAESFDEL